jgi:hypothetical protein
MAPDAPRLAVVSNLRNDAASSILKVCLEGIARFTPEPHEVWVIDNNSPVSQTEWLKGQSGINVALNRTEPLPPESQDAMVDDASRSQLQWGSYANAIGLELAVRLIDPQTRYLMTMHMDTLPCRSGWLSYLKGKLVDGTGAAGVRFDRTRTPEGILHVLGYMVDFHLFTELGLDFFPRLPEFDVGDLVTTRLREAGFKVFASQNTLWEPHLVETIVTGSPFKDLPVDRSLDDEGNVFFLHLGRGVRKSTGEHRTGITVDEWVRVAREKIFTQE